MRPIPQHLLKPRSLLHSTLVFLVIAEVCNYLVPLLPVRLREYCRVESPRGAIRQDTTTGSTLTILSALTPDEPVRSRVPPPSTSNVVIQCRRAGGCERFLRVLAGALAGSPARLGF